MQYALTVLGCFCLLISPTAFAQEATDAKSVGLINVLPLYQDDPDAGANIKGTIILPRLRVNGEETSLLGGKIHIDLTEGINSCHVTEANLIPRTTISGMDEGFNPDAATKLNAILANVQAGVDSGKIPGVVMRVDLGGKSWRAITGKSRMNTDDKRVYSDYFRIGSISKTFTAAAVLLLYQQGKVDLEDTMEKWFADESWYSQMPNGDKITLRYLLRHQSGLFNYVKIPEIQEAMLNDPTRVYSPEELLILSFNGKPDGDFEPGAKIEYSNTNFIIAGLLIEKITGQSAEKFIRDNLLKPFNMYNTMLGTDPGVPYYYSHGYLDADGNNNDETVSWKDVSYLDPSIAWTSGSVISNIDDLTMGFKCQVSRAEDCPAILFSEETLAERMDYVANVENGFNVNFGLGLLNICGFSYHVGAINGYETAVFYNPSMLDYGEVMITMSLNMYPNPSTYSVSNLALEVITTLSPTQCDSSVATTARTGQRISLTDSILGLKPGQFGF